MLAMVVISILAFLTFFIFVGYKYVREGVSRYASKQEDCLDRRRNYVKDNRAIFGIGNNGTSLDKRNIYVLSLEDLGISEVSDGNQ